MEKETIDLERYARYVGKLLDGRYLIEKMLGSGGMSVVFKATDLLEKHPVAIKMLRDDIAEDEEALQRFVNESKAVSMLSHPNIVGVYSISVEKKIKYIVMEYVEGISLRTYMDKKGILPLNEVLSFSEQILAALNHAHSKGIVHRDIKPQNIMLLANGVIKVTDFGIAKMPDAESTLGEDDMAVGTVYYISPEQAEQGYSDSRSDLYSLGILMYEMSTGCLPFEDERPITVVMMQIHNKPVPPRKINKSIPRGLQNIIMYSLEKNPKNRYETALDMFRELRRLDVNKRARVMTPSEVRKENRTEKNRTENKPSKATTPVILGVAFAILMVAIVSAFDILDNLKIGGKNRETLYVAAVAGSAYTPKAECESEEAYKAALAAIGLDERYSVSVEYEFSDYIDEGLIISQNPAPGASRKAPVEITLTVSKGREKKTVEDVTIMDWRIAKAKLMELGFSVKLTYKTNPSVKSGYVVNSNPAPGTTVIKGSTVTLIISSGVNSELIAMPDFSGLTEADAARIMENNSLEVGTVTYTRSSLPLGCVIAQSVPADTNVYAGETVVDFTVSGGSDFNTNVYPDVVGQQRTEAEKSLKLYGLKVTVIKQKSDVEAGTVMTQSPTAAEYEKTTDSVVLRVSGGPDYSSTVTVYSVVGQNVDDAVLMLNFCFGSDVAVSYEYEYVRDFAPIGTVIAQTPEAYSRIDTSMGQISVRLTVSGGIFYVDPDETTEESQEESQPEDSGEQADSSAEESQSTEETEDTRSWWERLFDW